MPSPAPPVTVAYMNAGETLAGDDIVLLDPADLANKWGFGDGDMFDDLLYDWARTRNFVADDSGYETGWPYVDSHMFLRAAVRRHVFPVIPKEIADHTLDVGSIHNPIRLPHWEDDPRADGWEEELNNTEPVRVRVDQLYQLADELFPHRSPHWIRIFNGLVGTCGLANFPDLRTDVTTWIDELDANADELQIIAELVGSSTEDTPRSSASTWDIRDGYLADTTTTTVELADAVKASIKDTLTGAYENAKRLLR